MTEFPPIVAIVGPTAVGKSRLALDLALDLSADIVAADSRQVYRYMDIGTAKPSKQEQALVPHHLIDLVEPHEAYSVRRYRDEGRRVLRRIEASRRMALVVGGTGFYVRALVDGLSLPDVPPDAAFRARMRAQAQEFGPEVLHERLRQLDPASADRMHANNVARVIRALEVIECVGGPVPPGAQRRSMPALYLGLTMDRALLREVASRRVEDQVKRGLVEETRLLLEMGYGAEAPAMQGFGYRHMTSYLSGGCDLAMAISAYQVATHQYIRRQMTWFRADERIHWISAERDVVLAARQKIEEWLSSASWPDGAAAGWAPGSARLRPGRMPGP